MRCVALVYTAAGGWAFVTCGVFNMISEFIGNARHYFAEGFRVFPTVCTVLNGYLYGLYAFSTLLICIVNFENIREKLGSVRRVGEGFVLGVKRIVCALCSGKIHAHVIAGGHLFGHIGKAETVLKSKGNTVMKCVRSHILILDFVVIIFVDCRARRLLFACSVRTACLKYISRNALIHAFYLRALILRQRVVSGLQRQQIKRTFIGDGLK